MRWNERPYPELARVADAPSVAVLPLGAVEAHGPHLPVGADVWIAGRKIGETPIGNLPISIGTHEVVFRHPDLGERRQTVTVTLKEVARYSADFTKP